MINIFTIILHALGSLLYKLFMLYQRRGEK